MSVAMWHIAAALAIGGMTWWFSEFIIIPVVFRRARQELLEAPAATGPMPPANVSFAGYYRRFRALGLNPWESAREALLYKRTGR